MIEAHSSLQSLSTQNGHEKDEYVYSLSRKHDTNCLQQLDRNIELGVELPSRSNTKPQPHHLQVVERVPHGWMKQEPHRWNFLTQYA